MNCRYTGDAPATYPDYLVTVDGVDQVLVAEPGGVYDMRPAEGREDLPAVPDGPWQRVKSSSTKEKE